MSKKKLKNLLIWIWPGIGILGIIVLSLLFFPRQVPAGVTLAGVDFGGLSAHQAIGRVEQLAQEFKEESIIFELDDHEKRSLSNNQLGISYDISKTVSTLMGNESLLMRILSPHAGATNNEDALNFQPEIQVDREVLSRTLSLALSQHEKSARDAQLELKDGQWEITTESQGEKLFPGELDRIQNNIIDGSYPTTSEDVVPVKYDIVDPVLSAEKLSDVQKLLNSYISEPIEVHYGDETTQLSFTDEENWLPIKIDGTSITLNEVELREWILNYSVERNREPGEVSITGIEEVESEYDGKTFQKAVYEGSFTSGWEIDKEQLLKDIQHAVGDSSSSRSITVSLYSKPPSIASEIDGVAFPDLLSVGKSNFEEGNYPDRVKNIDLSLGAFHSVIVPDGEEFSMNRTTGWITEDKGYTKTKVIYGGSVGIGVGGGVCQTSTTLYRSVINAGLPVTERRPHTLDVSYYHKYGYGLDAAVYTVARKDFQFVNDTGHPLLINAYTAPNDEAIVEIYGTSDGRTVELENIPTGIRNYKKWNSLVKWPEKEEKRVIESKYLR